MQIHELEPFIGEVSDDTMLAIDDGTETMKIPATTLAQPAGALILSDTITSLPFSIADDNITDDMVCVKAELGTPSAQTDDWEVTTNDGSLTITGTISGSTTLTLYLINSR